MLQTAAAGAFGGFAVGTAGAAGPPPERIVGTSTPEASREVERYAASVKRVLDFGAIGGAVAGRFSDEAVDRLRQRDDVRYVEEDGRMEALEQTLPWGIDRTDADVAHANGETGDGADVAIIDTGIDSDHADLEANLGAGESFVDCGDCNCWPFSCGNDNDCRYNWDDDNDHGTHCAGIADALDNDRGVVGVSTDATLHAVKVLDCGGSGSYSDVAAGIEYVADQGWDVGSLSLGGDASSAVEDACQYAYDNGVLLVAAAGNDGSCTDCVGYPAAYEECVAVSATSEDDSLASFSSTGPEVELAAPGEDIYSTVPGGYDTLSGTSMACPHVSGAGGQLMADGYANTEARQRLKDTAEDIGLSANEQGAGLLDAEAAVLDGSDGSNSSPSCSIVDPNDGDTVGGTVTVQVDASDEEDSADALDVEVAIDGGAWRTASYNGDTGYHEYDWDTTGVDDGDHTIDARATDSDGATADASRITVTVDNSSDGDAAPAIDQFEVTSDSGFFWTRYDVDWAVSDDDGDLSSVTSELLDSSGDVLDSESSAVGGDTASGTHTFWSGSDASEVRLTVADEAGNETADSKAV